MKKHIEKVGVCLKENKLIVSIVVAALLIAGSLVFLGLRMGGGDTSSKSFDEQLAEYNKTQEQAAANAQIEADQANAENAKNVPAITEDDNVLGKKDAEITIFEYSDFECPFCKRFYKTPAQLVKDNKGKVNTVYRHFPLPFHNPLATKEALASECAADQGKFWEYHDEIFERTNSNIGMEESELAVIAKDLKLNTTEFKACYDSEKHADKVNADMKGGEASGVTGTPGSIIKNNETGEVRFIAGAYPIESLQSAIDELLEK